MATNGIDSRAKDRRWFELREKDPAEPANDGGGTQFSPRDGGEETREPFYSALTRGVEALKLDKATPGQWEATIRNMPGIKAEERAWSGIEDWLRTQAKSVTKAEVLEHLRQNEVQVREVTRGNGKVPPEAIDAIREWARKEYGDPDRDAEVPDDVWEKAKRGDSEAISEIEGLGPPDHLMKPIHDNLGDGATKFGTYTLPGGKNYRELLLTLPQERERGEPINDGARWFHRREQ